MTTDEIGLNGQTAQPSVRLIRTCPLFLTYRLTLAIISQDWLIGR